MPQLRKYGNNEVAEADCSWFLFFVIYNTLVFQAPGSSPDMAQVDTLPAAVPPEVSYEEDWEVFDP